MKTKHLLLIGAAVQFVPALAHAQAEQNANGSPAYSDLLWAVLPLLLLFIVFLVVLFLIVRFAQSGPRATRANQHMERVEQQLERIAKALEKKDKDAE